MINGPFEGLILELHTRVDLGPFVYYIQCGEYVKIGTSINPYDRVKQLARGGKAKRPSIWAGNPQLLAVEFGSSAKEKERHREFSHLRDVGEWFHLTDQLVSHIEDVQFKQMVLEADHSKHPWTFHPLTESERVDALRAARATKPPIRVKAIA